MATQKGILQHNNDKPSMTKKEKPQHKRYSVNKAREG